MWCKRNLKDIPMYRHTLARLHYLSIYTAIVAGSFCFFFFFALKAHVSITLFCRVSHHECWHPISHGNQSFFLVISFFLRPIVSVINQQGYSCLPGNFYAARWMCRVMQKVPQPVIHKWELKKKASSLQMWKLGQVLVTLHFDAVHIAHITKKIRDRQ